jgi:hypothetical protein
MVIEHVHPLSQCAALDELAILAEADHDVAEDTGVAAALAALNAKDALGAFVVLLLRRNMHAVRVVHCCFLHVPVLQARIYTHMPAMI